ncbi:MAG: xanthine dehydrogenase family protein subunit M [Desulfurococcaceae archaeon]
MVVREVPINLRNTHILPPFEYYEPRTLDEASEILGRYAGEAKVLAGGTDLLVKVKTGQLRPKAIVNIKRIGGLRYIVEEGDRVRIGALTTFRDLELSETVAKHLPALHDVARIMGSVQIRTMATIGGNLCNASPAADSAPPLLVHNAQVRLYSKRAGYRTVRLEDFFAGPGKVFAEPDEILVEVIAEKAGSGSSAFVRVTRTAMDLSIASSAVYLAASGGKVLEVRVALGSVAPRPVRARKVEEALRGRELVLGQVADALKLIDDDISPITDVRSTAEYRRHAAKVLTYDALLKAYERLGGK